MPREYAKPRIYSFCRSRGATAATAATPLAARDREEKASRPRPSDQPNCGLISGGR